MQQQAFDFGAPAPPSNARRNVVIEAGAGTGKTTAIVAEVLKLLVERDDVSPERIVLMTFTEKAAGEIADRIRTALEELRESGSRRWPIGSTHPLITLPDGAARAIEHHLDNIDALRSQTIHSFCQSLLRMFPIEAGLDPQFKIIEGFERALLYGQLYDEWLDHETRVDPTPEIVAEWELLFAHVGYLFQIRSLVLGLIERRDLLEESGYEWGDFADVENSLTDAVLWIQRERTLPDSPIASYLRTQPFRGGGIEEWIAYLQPIAADLRQIDLRHCGPLKSPMAVLRSGDKGDSIYDRLVSHRAAMALVALTRRFLHHLDEGKRKLGVVDFDDLLLRTLALLDDPAVLTRARSQFDFIFVDEFQDTDRTQARIIDRLARDASDAYVPGKTIVVGDPKQSIYGFRRADPETYHRMTEELIRGGADRRRLGEQYRSDPPLLDAINEMFARVFPEVPHDPNVFSPVYAPLQAGRAAERRKLDARITLLHAEYDEPQERFFAEAEAIAEWTRLHGEGNLKRFAILFRRLTVLDDYLDTFDRHGIDYVLPPTRLFLDRRAPVDLLAVLRAIAHPFDKGAQISAARTPYFALTDEEIALGVLAENRAFDEFTASIARFRESARHLTVSQLIDLVIATTGIERVYDAAADGERHLRHLEHLRAIAFDYDRRTGGSLGHFVEEITERRNEPDEVEPSLIDESQNAVRIMSVHAAKGLEFDTVILPDLAMRSSRGDQLFAVEEPARSLVLTGRAASISGNFRFAAGEPLKDIASRRERAETKRLFYVAVTRAETEVVFVCSSKEKQTTGFFGSLTEALGIDRVALGGMWPAEGREVKVTAIGPVAFERLERSVGAKRRRRRLNDEELQATLTSSDIVACEIPVPEPATTTLSTGEVAALRSASRNRAGGILLHRVLERWDGTSDAGALLEQLATEAAADAETVARVRRRLATIARSTTQQRIARAETVGREVPVRFVEEGVLVERRIDRLIRENGSEVVIDYKSGAAEQSRVERDRIQVARYCRAISEITGRPCSGLLWYVDVENDAVVEV